MTTASHAVLIVEDEPHIRGLLKTALALESFRVLEAENVERGIVEARSHKPDLVILDLGLPDGDGLEVIRAIREWSRLPIIVLSARTQEEQKVSALDLGADDFVTKPFGAKELLARIRVALRHAARPPDAVEQIIKIGDWAIDLARREVTAANGRSLHLTPIEFRLLTRLASQSGLVVTHRQLLKEVWGPNSVEQTQYLRVYMKQLREKLEPDPTRPRHLLTETGVGYRLVTAPFSDPAQ